MQEKNIGSVVQIIGPVLDIRFQDGQLPESAFLFVGTIEEAVEKAKKGE